MFISLFTKGETIMEETKKCKKCGKEIPTSAKVCPYCNKKQKGGIGKILLVVLIIILFVAGCSALFGGDDDSNGKPKPTTEPKQEATTEENSEDNSSDFNVEDFKASCQEVTNFKDMMRTPDNYIGQRFKVTVKISTVESGSGDYKYYYKAYTNDENDWWMGDFYYLADARQSTDEGYVKLLEDDIATVYGVFNGLMPTQNGINGTEGEEMSLDIYYAELAE